MPETGTETMRICCKIIAKRGGSHSLGVLLAAACAVLLLCFLSANVAAREFERPIKIGVLSPYWENTQALMGLREGLEILGYRENIDYVLGIRFTSGDIAGLPRAVRELLEMGADIFFANIHHSALVMKQEQSSIPLVFLSAVDPVEFGLVRSFAKPGGNSTGITVFISKLLTKILEIYTLILPGKKRFLFVAPYKGERLKNVRANVLKNLEQSERQLKIDLDIKFIGNRKEALQIMGGIRRKDVDGILIPDFVYNLFGYALEASRREKIPLMMNAPFTVERGALASYGPDLHEMGRQSARLMDKIIRGEDAGKIPVEVTDRMKLVINLKVARELGITIPSEMLFRADRIIR